MAIYNEHGDSNMHLLFMIDGVITREIGSNIAQHGIYPPAINVLQQFSLHCSIHEVPANEVDARNWVKSQQVNGYYRGRSRDTHSLHHILRPAARSSPHIYHNIVPME